MNRFFARVRRSRRGDEGVTLAELSVSMVILGVLISMVAVVVVQAYRLQSQTISRENETTDAQITMDTMSRALRVATYLQDQTAVSNTGDPINLPAFSEFTNSAVTFTALVGSAPNPASSSAATDPVQIRYSLSGGVLTQTTTKPVTAGKGLKSTFGGSGTSRVLARNVTSATTSPLFEYSYKQSDGSISTTRPATNAALAIRQVRIRLTVDSDASGKLPGTSFDTTIANQNLAD